MLLTAGERISMALLCMAVEDLGRAGGVVHRLAGRDRHRHRPRQGEDHRGPRRPHPRGARRGQGRDRRRLPGRVDRAATSPRWAAAAPTPPRSRCAAALGADVCEIYTDVEGVYTADPRIVPTRAEARARLVRRDARDGRDRRPRARAAVGRVRAQPRRARCTFVRASPGRPAPGSPRRTRDDVDGAGDHLRRHARHRPRPRSRSSRCPTGPVSRRRCSATLAEAGINVDMIVQNVSTAGHTDISFTRAARRRRAAPRSCMDKIVVETEARGLPHRRAASAGSRSIGAGMKTHPGIAAKMFETLADRRHQHRDDQHVDDPDLVRGRRRRRRARGAGVARGVRARRSE